MISECDLDGNGNLIGAPRQQGRRLLPADAAIMSPSILGYGSTVYPVNTQMSPPNREAPRRQRHLALRMLPVTSGRCGQAAKLAKLLVRRGSDAEGLRPCGPGCAVNQV
jgi:hypothetical protein